jgi:DNA-binding XRE family transcriptional regulator
MPRPTPGPGASAQNPAVPSGAAVPKAEGRSWEQVRSELGLNTADVARHRTRFEADAGACRLAEIRKHRRITQQDLAETLGVSQSRVSQIERQGIDDTVLSTLAAYVEALGASILVVADFGEEQFALRRVTGSAACARSDGETGPSFSNETGTAAGSATGMSCPGL